MEITIEQRKSLRKILKDVCHEANCWRYNEGFLGEQDWNEFELVEKIAVVLEGGGKNAMD